MAIRTGFNSKTAQESGNAVSSSISFHFIAPLKLAHF